MVSLKRTIAALIVCFKPHVFLTLCILLVIAHSIVIAVHKGTSNSWRIGKQHDITLTMTTLILVVALIWAAFFIFIVRFELRNELESLLVLFQCSKRGLRFLGVVVFHLALLGFVALLVSSAVERSIPDSGSPSFDRFITGGLAVNGSARSSRPLKTRIEPVVSQFELVELDDETLEFRELAEPKDDETAKASSSTDHLRSFSMKRLPASYEPHERPRELGKRKRNDSATIDRDYLLTVYKIWLTAIVYAFLYLIIENLIMFYVDMSLVEFVHSVFLTMVAKLTGIDLSDYPAGEMLFNPLVRHRIR